MNTRTKITSVITLLVIAALAAFVYFRFFFVFGEGVKSGELNQVVYKGYLWKTYEGRLIQSGFKGAKGGGTIQSNEFNFSVEEHTVADSLMRCSGKNVEVHYKEYLGALPWRGVQKYVVDHILSVSQADNTTVIPISAE